MCSSGFRSSASPRLKSSGCSIQPERLKARSETPNLILLDVQMTPVSGKDVMRDIKATPELSDIPVAFFTGNDDAAEKRELASLGAWQIFKKPFSPKTFSDQVLSLFEAR